MINFEIEATNFIKENLHSLTGNESKSFSILTGLGSRILSKINLCHYYSDSSFKQDLDKDIATFFELIESSGSLSPTYCGGLSGAAWLIIYLNDHKFIEIDPDIFLEEIDLFIESKLSLFFSNGYYDILHGGLGIGFYFLKRGKVNKVVEIINFLEQNLVEDQNGYKWLNKGNLIDKKANIDFGLAHGQASILYFLGKCYTNNISKSKCRKLIDGIIRFYLETIQDYSLSGSFWPNAVTVKDYLSGVDFSVKSRLAWCYGDLGILHTLFLCSTWLKDDTLKTKIENLLVITTRRITPDETMIENEYFCHGISGIIVIYMNLFHLSGNNKFLKAAKYWGEIMLQKLKNNKTLILRNNTGILEGSEGIFLSLNSLKSLKEENWIECVFLR